MQGNASHECFHFSLSGDVSSFIAGGISLALKHSTLSEKLTVQTSLFTFNKVTASNSNFLLNYVLVSRWGKKTKKQNAQHICSHANTLGGSSGAKLVCGALGFNFGVCVCVFVIAHKSKTSVLIRALSTTGHFYITSGLTHPQ